jgi:3-oxoacyl-[acyl-carrier-protein] synthase II
VASRELFVAGVVVDLPTGGAVAELAARLVRGRRLAGTRQRFEAPHTDLAPAEARVGECPGPGSTAPRQRALPRESRLAAAVAASAMAGTRDGGLGGDADGAGRAAAPVAASRAGDRDGHRGPAPDGGLVGTVWVSSTAGLEQYGQICVDAATLEPGLASPLTGPQSAYNGPASAVSLRLGLTGPQLTLTGGADSGAAALAEAGRMLEEEECAEVLVGGSASLSRWRLAGAVPAGATARTGTTARTGATARVGAARPVSTVPAEGAVCLRLTRDAGPGPAVAVRPLRRARLRQAAGSPAAGPGSAGEELARFVKECVAQMSAAPAAIALSAAGPAELAAAEPALRACAVPCWHVERLVGDLGAAGGLLAVVAAVAACRRTPGGPPAVLVLALGGGQAVAVEVLSRAAAPSRR